MLEQCRNPIGAIGRFVGARMNERHPDLWEWGLSHVSINDDDIILDAGCGGGASINLLAKYSTKGMICGVDHSKEMVELSKETNKDLIDSNRVKIHEATISKLPFSDNTFNLVTAFETYTFWPDIPNDFKEVRRGLQPGGMFLIVHSAYNHKMFEERNNHWINLFRMQIYSLEEINRILMHSRFDSIRVIDKADKNRVTAVARKPFE
jgi:ubiquinone/menaquinone biosynthesis C-methylase UbiE